MKLLVFSDIHGDKSALEKLVNTEADYYFADGDLTNWGRGLDQLGPIMQKRAERMYVLPGNHESEADITRFCRQFGFHRFEPKMDLTALEWTRSDLPPRRSCASNLPQIFRNTRPRAHKFSYRKMSVSTRWESSYLTWSNKR
ncbi:MAG TPA: metallophosphoesterase family protein [Bryobacteraceae bacterium]|nr:metallophosphoesterase family protein [Bryobacteraceae bacterium]